MGWPAWIDAVRERYLADEGNLFLLTGAVGAAWPVDGERLGAVELLARLLSPTRPIVGVLRPGEPLVFPHLGDELRFERALSAREVVEGRRIRRRATDLGQRLDRVHACLQSTAHDQAWIFVDAQRLFPAGRPLECSEAPPLDAWADPLRPTNHIVLLLAPSPDDVAAELVRVAVHVPVEPPPPEPPPPEAPGRPDLTDTISAEPPVEAPAPVVHEPADDPTLPTDDELAEELEAALRLTLPLHPVSARDSRLPVIEAAAIVVGTHRPSVGLISLSLDDEGRVRAAGPAAEDFLARWEADVALDAAAGMLLRELPPDGDFAEQPLHPTALKALARRLLRLLARWEPAA